MTMPAVFGLAPAVADDRTVSEAVNAQEAGPVEQDALFEEEPGHLVAEVVDLFASRGAHWISSHDGFTLRAGPDTVVLSEDAGGWRVTLVDRAGVVRQIAAGLDLGYAQGCGEDLVRQRGGQALAARDARWRSQPASDRQLHGLARWGIHPDTQLSAGEASDRITVAIVQRAMSRQRKAAAGGR